MRKLGIFALGIASTLLAACPPPRVDPQPAPAPDVGGVLKGKSADTYTWEDLIKDRVLAPNITTLKGNPAAALGVVYTRIAKDGNCKSTDAKNFVFRRHLDFRNGADCKIEPSVSRRIAEKRIEGGVDGKLQAILGAASATNEYAFELIINEPTTVALTSTRQCADFKAVATTPLNHGTCDVNFITGVTITEVNFRTYRKFEGNADLAFSIVKINGTAYYNTTDFNSDYIFTVDPVSLNYLFGTNVTSGALMNLPADQINTALGQGITAKGDISGEAKRIHEELWLREKAAKQ